MQLSLLFLLTIEKAPFGEEVKNIIGNLLSHIQKLFISLLHTHTGPFVSTHNYYIF